MIETGVLAPVKSPVSSRGTASRNYGFAPAASPAQTRLDWNVAQPQPGCHAVRSQGDLMRLWNSQGGIGQPPMVDFERFMVLAVFAGKGCRRETLTINRIKQDETFTTVYVCAFTQRWTTLNPMHVVQVPRTETPIQFVRLG